MLPRQETTTIQRYASKFPVIGVLGPRQSGKTTLVRAAFPDHRYVNLDLITEAQAAAQDPEGFLRLKPSAAGLIIDEAQNVPELFSTLLPLVDEDQRPGRYILTGSQNFAMHARISESLAGRIALRTLLPLSIREALTAPAVPATLDQWLWTGLFPSVFLNRFTPDEWYPEYITTYVQRDVRQLLDVGDLRAFTLVLKLCAGRIGQLLDLTSLATEAGVAVNTIKRWLSILEASYVISLVSPHHRNYNKRLVKTPKLYFMDTGLALALLGITTPGQVASYYQRGNLFENMIYVDLLKQAYNRGQRPEIYFWREHSGMEVDFVLERPEGLLAIEVKSSVSIHPEAADSLLRYGELAGIPTERRLLVYGGTEADTRREFQLVPWQQLEAYTGSWLDR
ncbi:MAG: ATP-binding protein [Chlamydiia bacterium]